MAADPELSILVCRATLRATRTIHFQPPAANLFRGVLGTLLPEEIFRPTADSGPSGLRDRPRPFVLRCAHLDSRCFEPGEAFETGLHVFSPDPDPFRHALGRLDFAELEGWHQQAVRLPLSRPGAPVSAVRVEFLTPTELKPPVPRGEMPSFTVLLARLRDRISALRAFYGPGPLDLDYRAFLENSRLVAATGGELRHVSAGRTSRGTGQTHPLGGFTGHVDYSGPIAPFLPWLEAGFYSGVGRQTVWGKGVVRPVIL